MFQNSNLRNRNPQSKNRLKKEKRSKKLQKWQKINGPYIESKKITDAQSSGSIN
jgi:hypothetical protein